MSSRRLDPRHAGQDEQGQPYEGKHRAPEARSHGLRRSVARIVLGQPTAPPPQPPDLSPQPPDLSGSDSSEVPGDQQATNDRQ